MHARTFTGAPDNSATVRSYRDGAAAGCTAGHLCLPPTAAAGSGNADGNIIAHTHNNTWVQLGEIDAGGVAGVRHGEHGRRHLGQVVMTKTTDITEGRK